MAGTDPLIGSVIDGRYEVRAALGHGGMGRLYRAWQASVRREVAIKVIDRSIGADPMAVTRFQREAELASKLSHPNTVSVFDFGRTAGGQLYIAMELIAGKTLTACVREQGAFSLARVARIGIQLCDALEAAHRLGIVHRDLKLDNVMVLDEPAGRDLVKILDFGLAKKQDDVGGTAMGIVVGTPRYIAPEVAISGVATPASDMYAVGVMLAELASGATLWSSDNLQSLVAQKLQPREIIEVPPALRVVTKALLDPRPERRPTAAQARALLERAEQGEVVDAPAETPTKQERVVRRPRPKRRWLAVAAVSGAVVAGTAAVVATRASDEKRLVPAGSARDVASASPAVGADPWQRAERADPWQRGGPDLVKLHVTSLPSGGEVQVDGEPHGITPVDVEVPRDQGAVIVSGRLGWRSGQVTVRPEHARDVKLILTKSGTLHGACAQCVPEGASNVATVVLKIRGPASAGAIEVAGSELDSPPFDLLVRKTTKPLELIADEGGHTVTLTVVPDHAQVVMVAPCEDCVEK